MSGDLVKRLRWWKGEIGELFEAADRIEQLETANLKQSLITVDHLSRIEKLGALVEQLRDDNSSLIDSFDKDFLRQESRIEKLEAALRHCINALKQYEMGDNRPRGPIPNDDLRPWLLGAMDNAIKTLEGKDD